MGGGATKEILLIAMGGNALIEKGQEGTVEEQFENLKIPMAQIARLSRGYKIIITHGNAPQVGNLLLQQECCDAVPNLPLEILVAQTQGQIGYMIESSLDSALMELGIQNEQMLVSLLSYVVVDQKDPSFQDPSKPIGPVFTEQEARRLPYPTVTTNKNGYRRVVASPRPKTIVEKREIRRLLEMDFIVICCGGGGIPVIREGRGFQGVDAVIDKDLASARLAEEVGVNLFLMGTDVAGAALGYGTTDERFLRRLTVEKASQYMEEGRFPRGSMGPKVEAAVQFIQSGGKRAVICSIRELEKAVAGEAGTEVVR